VSAAVLVPTLAGLNPLVRFGPKNHTILHKNRPTLELRRTEEGWTRTVHKGGPGTTTSISPGAGGGSSTGTGTAATSTTSSSELLAGSGGGGGGDGEDVDVEGGGNADEPTPATIESPVAAAADGAEDAAEAVTEKVTEEAAVGASSSDTAYLTRIGPAPADEPGHLWLHVEGAMVESTLACSHC